MIDTTETGERRLEVTRGRDGRIVLASIGGGMPVAIRMTDAETQSVIVALAAEASADLPADPIGENEPGDDAEKKKPRSPAEALRRGCRTESGAT